MSPIVILEDDYETLNDAIAAKDAQTADLTNQSIPFQQQTLYRATDGARVFLITPIEPEAEADESRTTSSKPRTRRTSPQRRRDRTQQVDYR
ncbi:MAG: hypothetical protein AAF609_01450 [Cyanobacteria bacterium P01_C01_bin.120]